MSDVIKKNKPCPCGSGKKYKNCCASKKTRLDGIVFKIDKVVKSIRIGPNNEIFLFDRDKKVIEPVWTNFRRSYERHNKSEKTLTEVPLRTPKFLFNEVDHLCQYNILFALDANTKIHNERKISAATFIQCILEKQIDSVLASYQIVHQHYWLDLEENAEKIALCDLVHNINIREGNKVLVGIVTDCDYGNLSKLNAGEIPILGDIYLPANIKLIYASSDTGKEALSNQLVSECDKESNIIIADIINNFSHYELSQTVDMSE
ncbi:YecA family protein [Propionispora hippei]|uniref:SEC-C motif-containing protein n=1 Tax=Propionispora hippei DSM 15287 TaxID=1123003 RepID=A0A1M6GZC5_9FIRM|nr:SEC-C metal-binding domain-containing protein [Propionispora hippei]SHJ15282.1 SEC-C motif-containing protein [Propionispora hippei DSM 15287]